MSEEHLKAFLAKVAEDAGLRDKLQVATGIDAVVALAKEAGFDVHPADITWGESGMQGELSDEDLEGLAGGDRGTTVTDPGCVYCVPCRFTLR